VTNTLAYCGAEYITAVKSFMEQFPGLHSDALWLYTKRGLPFPSVDQSYKTFLVQFVCKFTAFFQLFIKFYSFFQKFLMSFYRQTHVFELFYFVGAPLKWFSNFSVKAVFTLQQKSH